MEGLFKTSGGAAGHPRTARYPEADIDNSLIVPKVLSFLTYRAGPPGGGWTPSRPNWPDNIPLLYYSYHIMVGLGTIFVAVMILSALLLWRRKLFDSAGCSGS